MRTLIATFTLLFALMLIVPAAHAQNQDMDELMKQLQDQGMSEQDMQKMMEQLGTMMPKPVKAGSFTHPELNYTITIPDGWSGSLMGPVLIAVNGENVQQMYTPDTKAFMVFVETEDDVQDRWDGKSIDDIDVEEFSQAVRDAMHEQANLNDIEIKELERTKVNGHTAIHVLQRFRADNSDMGFQGWMMAEMFVFQLGKQHLNVVYMAPEENWSDYEGFVDNNIKTLNF